MGELAYITILIGSVAMYSAYSTAQDPEESGYFFAYFLAIGSLIVGIILGGSSILSGEFISGLVAIVFAGFSIATVISIAIFGFAKENPEEAAAAASAVAGAAKAVDEVSNSGTGTSSKSRSRTGNPTKDAAKDPGKDAVNEMKKQTELKRASFKMDCPSCGQTWGYNDEGIVSGDSRIGYSYIGYDEVLERTEIQCTNCGTTKKVDRKI